MTRQEQIKCAILALFEKLEKETFSGSLKINFTNGFISNKVNFNKPDKLVVDFCDN